MQEIMFSWGGFQAPPISGTSPTGQRMRFLLNGAKEEKGQVISVSISAISSFLPAQSPAPVCF